MARSSDYWDPPQRPVLTVPVWSREGIVLYAHREREIVVRTPIGFHAQESDVKRKTSKMPPAFMKKAMAAHEKSEKKGGKCK